MGFGDRKTNFEHHNASVSELSDWSGPQRSPMRLDNGSANGQAQAQAVRLGGEKRLEQVGSLFI